ncbi:hypothetical protein EBZ80_16675 [bacterium]|nr:hypothetical protein [bacterium]
MSSINLTTTAKADRVSVAFAGKIDENAKYGTIDLGGKSILEFDFEKVELINSMGLQNWVSFMKALPANVAIHFVRCPLRIVNQMNLFPGFMGERKVVVESFYAGYFCEACDASHNNLLTRESVLNVGGGKPKAPEQKCPKCQKAMEFDGIEDKYFAFLK